MAGVVVDDHPLSILAYDDDDISVDHQVNEVGGSMMMIEDNNAVASSWSPPRLRIDEDEEGNPSEAQPSQHQRGGSIAYGLSSLSTPMSVACLEPIVQFYSQCYFGRRPMEIDSRNGETPLTQAVKENDISSVFVFTVLGQHLYQSHQEEQEEGEGEDNHGGDNDGSKQVSTKKKKMMMKKKCMSSSPPSSSVCMANSHGQTPLDLAIIYDFVDIARLLLLLCSTSRRRCYYDASTNNCGYGKKSEFPSPLHAAAFYGRYRIAQLLLEYDMNLVSVVTTTTKTRYNLRYDTMDGVGSSSNRGGGGGGGGGRTPLHVAAQEAGDEDPTTRQHRWQFR